jgi:hypothetical protein
MATELTVQSERAFQKQPHIFLNSKTKVKTARPGKNGRRWYKNVGLGFRTPKTAIEGSYIGKSADNKRQCGRQDDMKKMDIGHHARLKRSTWTTKRGTRTATSQQGIRSSYQGHQEQQNYAEEDDINGELDRLHETRHISGQQLNEVLYQHQRHINHQQLQD